MKTPDNLFPNNAENSDDELSKEEKDFFAYIDGKMPQEEKKIYEKKLEGDPVFKKDFEIEYLTYLQSLYSFNQEMTDKQTDDLLRLSEKYPEMFSDQANYSQKMLKAAQEVKIQKNRLRFLISSFLSGQFDKKEAPDVLDFLKKRPDYLKEIILESLNNMRNYNFSLWSSVLGSKTEILRKDLDKVLTDIYNKLYNK